MVEKYDILVAGGGLVGATFAACLAISSEAQGLKIGVIERQPFNPQAQKEKFDPRVVALTAASRAVLSRAGIWNEQVAARASAYTHMEVRDSEGTGLIEFDCAEVHQVNLGHIVENSLIVGAAHEQLASLKNIQFIYQEIINVSRDETSQHFVAELGNGEQISAPLLVASDGANSLVREQCGFKLSTWDYGHSAVVATIKSTESHKKTAYQWFSPSGPLAFLPLSHEDGDCHYSSIVWSQDHDVASGLLALPDEEFCRRITAASEHRLGAITSVSKRFCLPLSQRHATDYIKPGVALLGDAAHTIHPLAGQGVNLGFADVDALVAEIVRGLQRKLPIGHLSTLERYQRRRKPDNLAMMAAMEGFKRLFAHQNPWLRVLRNTGMSGLNTLSPVKNRLIRQVMGF